MITPRLVRRGRFAAGLLLFAIGRLPAATDVRVNFVLNTTDASGAPIRQNRYYYVYRPDGLSKSAPAPVVVVMDGGAPTFLHRKADEAGFVAVSASFSGNSSGTPGSGWVNDNPRIVGYEDYDYVSEVINRVRESDNCTDAFVCGLSKGGHMSLAYACERPSMIRAAASLDEFMGLTSNIPSAPVPIMMIQGTLDTNVPYTMVRDTADAWRAVNGLLNVTPVTTYESSRRTPGKVMQATWRGGAGGTQVAFVTIIGGTHTYPTPAVETGYDFTDGMWAFFSQFLTAGQDAPKIVSQPVNNVQSSGQQASFWVAATGSSPLSYQWQKNGADIPGATANWLTVPAAPADNGATFRAVVRNDAGVVTSPSATLTVTAAPNGPVVTAPPADQAVAAGQPATFTAAADGDPPLRFQWQKNGVDIAGATGAVLSLPAAIAADSGANFSVVVANAAGSVSSARAMLTVTTPPGAPILLANPARVRVRTGGAGAFSVLAWSASPMTYQWQKGTFTGNMADIPGATGASYAIPSGALADHLTLFRCVVANAAGNAVSASEMLFVTGDVKPPTDITSPTAVAAQAGVPFQYTIVSTGGTAPLTYSAAPLPAGLALDPMTGLISGTPSETGAFAILLEGANSAGKFSRVLTLTVTTDPPVISLDAWRFATFGASAIDPSISGDAADPDGDGFTNLEEFHAGSNPLDASSVPSAPAANRSDRRRGPPVEARTRRDPRRARRA